MCLQSADYSRVSVLNACIIIKLYRGQWGAKSPVSTHNCLSSMMHVCSLTFQRLIDVVVQVVHSQAVFEAGGVLLNSISHHINGYITVVLPHLAQGESNDSF